MSYSKNSTKLNSSVNDKDKHYMARALELAQKGEGFVNPNPLVGAVIVKDDVIIGEGYHEQFGQGHAEVNAFKNAKEDVTGATMYVTLEPCSHYGKTPPCALKIIEKGIKRVVISKLDPNPLVYKNGVKLLEDAGIEVSYGLLEEQANKQNDIFLKYIQTEMPFVAIKYAMTLDGKIATKDYDSKWITNEKSRKYVHQLRNRYMSILVGVNTIIKDDPKLDTRLEKGRNPIRIIIDENLNTPLDSYVVKTALTQKTYIVSKKVDQAYLDLGVRIIQMDTIDLEKLLKLLGKEKIDSILIEGGSYTHGAFLDSGLVDKVYAFIAPKIFGGKGLTPVGHEGISKVSEAYQLTNIAYSYFDEDILIEGYIRKEKQ